MKERLRRFDIVSKETMIFGHKNSKRMQSTTGGFISLLSYASIMSALIYFGFKLFSYDKQSIIQSTEFDENISLENANQIPFMMRISDEFQNPLATPSRYYSAVLTWVVADYFEGHMKQVYYDFNMEPCDISKHFYNYSSLFGSIPDLQTYYCLNWTHNITSLNALYGGKNPFTYFYFMINQCNTHQLANNCKSQAEIDAVLSFSFVDFHLLDNVVTTNSTPYNPTLYSDRVVVSNLSQKRIWLGLRSIFYYNDLGLVLQEYQKSKFFQVETYRHDVYEKRKIDIETNQSAFLAISIQNHKVISSYYRTFVKMQEFLANIGGITKAIMIISETLALWLGSQTQLLNLINKLPLITKEIKQSTSKRDQLEAVSKVSGFASKFVVENLQNMSNSCSMEIAGNSKKIQDEITKKLAKRSKVSLNCFEKYFWFLPFGKSSSYFIFKSCEKEIEQRLNLKSMLKDSIQLLSLKDFIFSKLELQAYSYLYELDLVPHPQLEVFDYINFIKSKTNQTQIEAVFIEKYSHI